MNYKSILVTLVIALTATFGVATTSQAHRTFSRAQVESLAWTYSYDDCRAIAGSSCRFSVRTMRSTTLGEHSWYVLVTWYGARFPFCWTELKWIHSDLSYHHAGC